MIFPFNSMQFSLRAATASLALAGLLAAPALQAQGDLLVAPTRVVIEGNGSTQIILSNIGDKEATYRISLELRRMMPDGSLEPVETDAANNIEKAAMEMIRYAPRRVVLPPGQPQAVRLSARPAPELPDGEYRVHMSFNGLPDVDPVIDEAEDEIPAGGFAVRLIPIYGITIPVIVRKGHLEATAVISNPRIEPAPNGGLLRLDMARSGTGSVFGELRIVRPGDSDPVFLARGIAIYPELEARELTLPINAEQVAALKGRLRFEYRELPEQGGALLAAVEGEIG